LKIVNPVKTRGAFEQILGAKLTLDKAMFLAVENLYLGVVEKSSIQPL